MKPATSRTIFVVGIVALLSSLLIVSTGNAQWNFRTPWGNRSATGASVSAPAPTESEIVRAVEQSEGAVVSVIITEELPVIERRLETVPSPFGDSFEFQIPRFIQRGTEKREVGGGTAFFVSGNGLLLTNKHVVEDEEAEYTVLLNDGRKIPAEVVALDATNDIALIRVSGRGYTALPIAGTDDLKLGQTAIAIGNALGEFRNTVSVGVVSGLRRSITAGGIQGGGTERLDEIIQTDAAINRGNSGGPLLNARGEVIGMSTAVAADAQSIGFAIPASELRRVLQSYERYGRIVRPYLGVRYVPVTDDVREQYKVTAAYGVLVTHGEGPNDAAVLPGSPADKAGLKEGDVILEIDGRKLTADVSFLRYVQTKNPGESVTLTVLRGGKQMEARVTVEEWKE